jgi:hypothetical protein
MTDTPDPASPDALRLALEAAEAATDAAGEAQTLRRSAEGALARLDKAAGRTGPLLIGCLVGSVSVLGLGALFHLRALDDMRIATAAQIEALAVFTTRVGDLDAQLEAVATMTDSAAALGAGVDACTLQLEETLDARLAEMAAQHVAEHETTRAAASQATTALLDALRAGEETTLAAITAGASDLQLALSRMLATGLPAGVAAATDEATVPAAASQPRAATATPATIPVPRPARAPRPQASAPRTAAAASAPAPARAPSNPFSFP